MMSASLGMVAVAPEPDALVTRLSDLVTGLAQGNGVDRNAISTTGSRVDRPMSLIMEIGLSWWAETRTAAGRPHVEGSEHCSDEASAEASVRLRCEALLADPRTGGGVAERVRSDPHGTFRDMPDEFDVDVEVVRSHRNAGCGNCGQTGRHACTDSRCGGTGLVPCNQCTDGKRPCSCNYGKVTRQESVYDGNTRTMVLVSVQATCGYCGGSGRVASCGSCGGTMRTSCGTCIGRGWINCAPCGSTGWLTYATQARVIGRPDRTASFPDGTPRTFIEQVGELPLTRIHDDQAATSLTSCEVIGRYVRAVFTCEMPHLTVEARFANVLVQEFHALGSTPTIVWMPPFLDVLIGPAVDGMEAALTEGNAGEAVRLAMGTRVTAAVLATVSGARDGPAGDIASAYGRSLSADLLSRASACAISGYSGLGRASVRRRWLLFGLPAVLAAAAIPAFGLSQRVVHAFPAIGDVTYHLFAFEAAIDFVLALLPVAVLWRTAGNSGRRAVREVVGVSARRRPTQGRWPAMAGVLALAAATGGTVLTRVPGVPRVLPGLASLDLSPGTLPALPSRPEPSNGRDRQDVRMIRVILGFIDDEMDDVYDHALVEAFLQRVPLPVRSRQPVPSVNELAVAARWGKFRLLPHSYRESPAVFLSSAVRESLTEEDTRRMTATTLAAMAEAGKEKAWRSADGKRGGRVKASARTGKDCAIIDQEVQVNGGAEHVGAMNVCLRGRRWEPD